MTVRFAGGMRLTAARLNAATLAGSVSTSSVDTGSFTTASTSYTTTNGGIVGVTFVAPDSGVVLILWEAAMATSGATGCLISFELKTGASIGSGTPITPADDGRAIDTRVSTNTRPANFWRQTGLTAGDTYNVRLVHKSLSAANSTILRRELSVTPIQ